MFVISLLSRLPLRVLYAFASVLAFVAHRVLKYRLRVVRGNIDLCFPHLSVEEREKIIGNYYKHLADIIVEAVWFGGCNRERLAKQQMVTALNPEVVKKLSDNGRSMVVLSSHHGNWELSGGIGIYCSARGESAFKEYNTIYVYKKLTSKAWNEFMHRNRIAPLDAPEQFQGYIETNEVLRHVIANRNEQKFYNFITDQRPYRTAKGSVPVTFMGQQCQSMAAAANLALHYGFNIVYQRMRWVSRGHYTYEFIPIEVNDSTTAQDIMNRYYELLSQDIMSQPEQYLWSHKRFA